MKTIGLIGGMEWPSTIDYYRIMNTEVARRLGSHDSARIIVYSLRSGEVYRPFAEGKTELALEALFNAGRSLKKAGADFLLLGSNTSHIFADEVEREVALPLINIIDVTAKAILEKGIKRIGLLGTKVTMTRTFYSDRLLKNGISTIVPDESSREVIAKIINEELVQFKILDSSKQKFLKFIDNLKADGAEGVILGCTEIPMLIQPTDHALPLFDTTRLHAIAAVDAALG